MPQPQKDTNGEARYAFDHPDDALIPEPLNVTPKKHEHCQSQPVTPTAIALPKSPGELSNVSPSIREKQLQLKRSINGIVPLTCRSNREMVLQSPRKTQAKFTVSDSPTRRSSSSNTADVLSNQDNLTSSPTNRAAMPSLSAVTQSSLLEAVMRHVIEIETTQQRLLTRMENVEHLLIMVVQRIENSTSYDSQHKLNPTSQSNSKLDRTVEPNGDKTGQFAETFSVPRKDQEEVPPYREREEDEWH